MSYLRLILNIVSCDMLNIHANPQLLHRICRLFNVSLGPVVMSDP